MIKVKDSPGLFRSPTNAIVNADDNAYRLALARRKGDKEQRDMRDRIDTLEKMVKLLLEKQNGN